MDIPGALVSFKFNTQKYRNGYFILHLYKYSNRNNLI